MREIKFRGKATNRSSNREYRTSYKNGDWVYGLLEKHEFRLGDKSLPATMRNECGVSDIDVDEFTLGQYTGLKDKNGVEIYEGDIVRLHQLDAPKEVRWDDKQSRWCLIQNGYPVAGCNEETLKSYEIIGNIFDNPELLED